MTLNTKVSKSQKNMQANVNILALKRLSVLNHKGQEVSFQDFLELKRVVIILIRHFGCIACKAHVDQVWNLLKDLKSKNKNIIFIGNGSPQLINSFKEEMNVNDALVYTDPSLEVFDACGMNRGLKYTLKLRNYTRVRELQKEGYTQGDNGKESGSKTQMGGVVVFKKPGQVMYHYASEYAGDFDDAQEWGQDDDSSNS